MQWEIRVISNNIWRVAPNLSLHRGMNRVLHILTVVSVEAIQHPCYIRISRVLELLGDSINISNVEVVVIIHFSNLLAHHFSEAAENFKELF